MSEEKTREHADRFRAQLVKLIEDNAASMRDLGIVPTLSIARHEVADAASWLASQFADKIEETLSDREVSIINSRIREMERRDRIRNDPSIN